MRQRYFRLLMGALLVALLGTAVLVPATGATAADTKETAANVQAAPLTGGGTTIVCTRSKGCLAYKGGEVVRLSQGTAVKGVECRGHPVCNYFRKRESSKTWYYYKRDGWRANR